MDNTTLLRNKAIIGLEEIGKSDDPQYKEQLEYELGVVEKQGFVPYFLVMWDIANHARKQGYLYGPGRGSGAGSLLNYVLKITLVDPIKYGLYFERFLNPSRVSPPDIDWDCAKRDEIIEYLEERYGTERVARVGSLNFLRTKSAIRDVGRKIGADYKLIQEIIDLVPPPVAGLWESFDYECEVEPKLLDDKYIEIIEPVRKLWGVVRSYGTHAGGVAIAPGPINRFVPLYKDKDGNLVSQFDWRDLEACGLLKFDILGLLTLEVIQLCLDLIEKKGETVDLDNLEDGDKKAYELICSGDLDGIFQLGGSEGIKQLTIRIAPKDIEDLSLVTSLFRPGPLSSGMVEDAIKVRQGKEKPEYIHECLKDILDVTHSVPVFQEQVMRICTDLCGYTLPEADMMRKIMGKKLKDKMKEQEPKFIGGAISNGVSEEDAKKLFSQLQDYAQYLFNKCLVGETKVLLTDDLHEAYSVSINEIKNKLDNKEEVTLVSFNPKTKRTCFDTCIEVIDTGVQEVYEVELSNKSTITCTMNHKFLCSDMEKHPLWEIIKLDLDIVSV